MKRRALLAAGAGSVLAPAALLNPVAAQSFPSRPLRIVVPFTAGGAADLLARSVGQPLSEALKQSVIIENRAGGGTVIGTQNVLGSPPDGYSLLCMSNSFLLNSSLRAKPPYDALNDFVPVSMLALSPQAIVVHRSHPAQSLKAFIEWARQKGAATTYATVGPGTSQHVMGAKFRAMTGLDLTYVPFPGGAPAVTALVGGHVDMVLQNLSESIEQIRAGNLRALAVTGRTRLESMPDVPTIEESGLADFGLEVFFGLVARRGTPAEAVSLLNAEVRRALRAPAVRERLLNFSMFPVDASVEAFGAYLKTNGERFTLAARSAGVSIE